MTPLEYLRAREREAWAELRSDARATVRAAPVSSLVSAVIAGGVVGRTAGVGGLVRAPFTWGRLALDVTRWIDQL